MQDYLTKKDIGFRVTELRKKKGLSQEELAKRVHISRSSLTQIELGNRGVDVLELQKLSLELGFSLDEFLSHDFEFCRGSVRFFGEKGTHFGSKASHRKI